MFKCQKDSNSFFYLNFLILTVSVLIAFSQNVIPFRTKSDCFELSKHSQCECKPSYDNFTIHCGSFDLNISRKENLTIRCNNIGFESFHKELLPKFILGPIAAVNIEHCSLSRNETIKNILNHLGIENVEKFSFIAQQTSIYKHQLDGLRNVISFALVMESSEAIPSDLFKVMPNVMRLEFSTNQRLLPKGLFDPLTKLKRLYVIGRHQSIEFPAEIFRRQRKLKYLDIRRIEGLTLPKDIFANTTNITILKLRQNTMTTLPRGIFDNLTKLKFLHWQERKTESKNEDDRSLRTLPADFFGNLTNLITVTLSIHFKELPENLFKGSPSIKKIFLDFNKLQNLPVNLFRNQKNLTTLFLSYNLLETLPDDIFIYSAGLTFLDLSFNNLTTITRSIFRSLDVLQILLLNNNKISFIEDDAFPCTNLKALTLSHNHLTTISDTIFSQLNSLTTLALGNNNLNFIESDAFCYTEYLQTLNLDQNNLNENSMRIFFNCLFTLVDLKNLDISYNEIQEVTNKDLKFLSNIHLKINLKGNRIKTIDASLTDTSLRKSITLDLGANPIRCDWRTVEFVKYLKSQRNLKIRTENLLCKTPMKFQGKKLIVIDPCDLRRPNAYPKLCPDSCRCEERTCDNAFIINCSDSRLSNIPILPALDLRKFKRILLNLHNNILKQVRRDGSKSYDMIFSLNLTGNNLETIEAAQLPLNLEILDLRGNNLRTLPDSCFDSWSRNSSKVKQIYFSHNPWPCDCDSRSLLEFLQSKNNKVVDRDSLQCLNSPGQHQLLMHFKVSQLCPDKKHVIITIASTITISAMMISVLMAIYYKFKNEIKVWLYSRNMCLWFVSIEDLEKDKVYDGFVSYSHRDKDFVQNELLPFLEHGPHPFKICDHERDWLVGDTIPDQIIKSVENSRRTLIILSDNYLESVWGRMEFQAAHQVAMNERQAKVIIILYGEIKNTERIDAELKAYLNMNTYLEWGNPWFWRKLLYAMPHSKYSQL